MSVKHTIWWLNLAAVILAAVFVWAPLIDASIAQQGYGQIEQFSHPPSFGPHSDTYWPTIIQAFSAIAMVLLVGGQVIIAIIQNGIASRQADIQRAQHYATHCPKIIVRFVEFHTGTGDVTEDNWGAHVKYRLTNVGGSAAAITAAGFMARDYSPLAGPLSVENQIISTPTRILEAGESVEACEPITLTKIEFQHRIVGEKTKLLGITTADKILVFYGGVAYLDKNGVRRQTCVWRVLDTKTLRFVPVNEYGYDYSD